MKFVSLRGTSPPCTPSDAIRSGLASDGGLLVPESWPKLLIQREWAAMEFPQFAARVLAPFFAGDPLAASLDEICAQAFNFPLPLRSLARGQALLELFHGPTGAFKDFGARFLALCCERIPSTSGKPRLVLVATSGDTGGAVAAAFCECSRIPVAILYPRGRVSLRQEKQLTVWGNQVRAFAVGGTFDDCQRIVKEALADTAWTERFELLSANSINIGRLLPQMAYFAYASLQYQARFGTAAEFIVPSGNMGNSAGALWALRLGFPIRKVVFAHNANSAVVNYFRSGKWSAEPTLATLANAMDVGNPSNFERVRLLFADEGQLRNVASAVSVSDEQIRTTIKQAKARWNEVICPHTATAVFAGLKQRDADWVAVATAHPAKFESIIEPLLGHPIPVPPALQVLLDKPGTSVTIEPTLESLRFAVPF